jgi:hypothetical protein
VTSSSRKTATAGPADRNVARLLAALREDPKLGAIVREFEESREAKKGGKFGSNALKANGKLFALFRQNTLVVKLPNERVAALVAEGLGKPFDPGHGRLMKGWLTVLDGGSLWVELAREAHAYVHRSRR